MDICGATHLLGGQRWLEVGPEMSPHLFHRVPVRVARDLLEAAMDQPQPIPRLQLAVNEMLTCLGHDARDRSLDGQEISETQEETEEKGN